MGATLITAINSIYGKDIGRLYGNFPWIKISFGNSMICSDIWHKYHEPPGK